MITNKLRILAATLRLLTFSENVQAQSPPDQNEVCGLPVAEQIIDQQIAFYPNPSTGVYTVHNTIQGQAVLTVYNSSGQIITGQGLQSNTPAQLDLSAQPDGIYFYCVVNSVTGKASTGKLVIAR